MTSPAARVSRMERLFNATRRLAAESDPVRLVEAALDAVAAFVDADQGFVLLREDGGRPRVRASLNLDRETMRSERFKPQRQIAERAMRRGEPFLSASLDADSRVNPADSLIDAARSVIAIPMRARDVVMGVVYAERYHDGSGAFGVGDLRVLQICADLVAELVGARQTIATLTREIADLSQTRQKLERVTANLNEEVAAKSVELAQFERDLDSKNRALADKHALSALVGSTPQMKRIFETVERIANYPVPVLLTGEPGSGKTALARAIHHHSVRREAPFRSLNCDALPPDLLELELFGDPNASAESSSLRQGLLLEARDGTLLLKEIDALAPSTQVRLSEALRDSEVMASKATNGVRARVIVANRAPLADALEAGFSADLYHQINVVEIALPPLRARYEDIPALAQHINALQSQDLGLPERPFSASAMQLLVRFSWPGNVRQLSSTIRSSVLLSRGAVIEVDDLRLPSASTDDLPPEASFSMEIVAPSSSVQTRTEWEAKEKQAILDALVQSNWNKTRAADLLGVSRRNLYRKLARYGIEGS